MKYIKIKKITLLLFLLVASSSLFGQIDFNKVIPKTPEAASLIEKVDNPVNEYTGIPRIGIPIYTVQEGSISLPISLSYNAGGIKVSEEASTVGLGWTLNAGGSITRSLGGIDDFIAYFDGNNKMPDVPLTSEGYFNPDTNAVLNSNAYCEFMVNEIPTTFLYNTSVDYSYDNNPDNFYYNFNGYSGGYVLDRNGNTLLNKQEGLSIILNSLSANQSTWTIKTEAGTIYRFEKRQQTKVPSIPGNRGNYYSSWFLTQVVGINGETIDLIYRDSNDVTDLEPLRSFVQSYMVIEEVSSTLASTAGYGNTRGLTTTIDGVYLSEIQFSSGKVKLNYSNSNDRLDMRGSYSLNSIQVFSTINNVDNEIKKFDFNYSYFGSENNQIQYVENGDYSGTIAPFSENQSINARLRLDAITENNIKTHSFEYNRSPLGLYHFPNKTTFAQDYWGYYNGERNEEYFIPASQNVTGLSNRAPKENFAKTFSLKKITYPTKGYTEFDYELNTYNATYTSLTPPVGTVTKRKRLTNGTNDPLNVEVQFTTGNIKDNSIAKYKIHLPIYGFNSNMISQVPNNYGGESKIRGQLLGNYTLTTGTSNPDFTFSNYGPNGGFPSRENGIILRSNETYTLKARFDKLNGALYGQAWIEVEWIEIDDTSGETNKEFSLGGGLRIKEIRNFDNNNSPLSKRTFNYHYTEMINGEMVEKSYGRLKSIPNFRIDNYHIIGSYDPGSTAFTCDKKLFPDCLLGVDGRINTDELRPTIIASAGSSNSYSTDFGSYVGYDQVSVSDEDFAENKNGKTIFKFYNSEDMFRATTFINNIDDLTKYPPIRIPTNGLLYEKGIYKNDGQSYKLVHKIENKYEINDEDAATYILQKLYENPPNYILAGSLNVPNTPSGAIILCGNMRFIFYPYYSHLLQQTSSKETIFDLNGNNPVETEQKYYYDNDTHLQRTRIETTDSDNLTLETKIYYPDDINSTNSLAEGGNLSQTEYNQIDRLKKDDLHRITTPIQTVTKRDGQILSIQRNLFSPKDGIVLPSITEASKGTNPLEERLLYNDYENGKPIHILKKDGPDISYIWGYENQFPIAKIENLPYSSIPTSTINDLKNKSNLDNDRTIGTAGNEGALRSALNSLRNSFPQAMITSFTYDPLIGVTSITDPKGYTAYYDYDELERLKFVKDQEGKLISENKYHYKD